MRVLLDTDVVLDLVLAREPFAQASAQLFKLHEQGKIDVCQTARQAVELLLGSLAICPLSHSVLDLAYKLPFADYEDAVQHASATANGLYTIVTRDINDYTNATLPVFSPTDFLKKLESQQT